VAWLFTHVYGKPIELKTFSEHWRRRLRALVLRPRGLEKQIGVRWETLRRHYGDPQSKGSMWNAALLDSTWVQPTKIKATSEG
jgi:hypothetical protein